MHSKAAAVQAKILKTFFFSFCFDSEFFASISKNLLIFFFFFLGYWRMFADVFAYLPINPRPPRYFCWMRSTSERIRRCGWATAEPEEDE
jgi:hypothetical protein